jgi:hypothetical protein
MPEAVFMKHGTRAHLNGVLHKSLPSVYVSVSVSPLLLQCNSLVKIPSTVASQRLGKTLPRRRIDKQVWKNFWTRMFPRGLCRIKENKRIVLAGLPVTSYMYEL